MNSPVRLGVSPAAASTPTGVFSQRFWGFVSRRWDPGLCSLSRSPVVPPGLPIHKRGTAQSDSCHLATYPLCPSCPSPPLLPVGLNVSSLTPWLLDLHTVWYSGRSGYFSFLNLLLPFWLCEEAKCVYLHLHIDRSLIDIKCSNIRNI